MEISILAKIKLKDIKEDWLQKKKRNNCFNCIYYHNNHCRWYFYYKKTAAIKIPNKVIDNGCKFWKTDVERLHPLTNSIIIKFEGVFVDWFVLHERLQEFIKKRKI